MRFCIPILVCAVVMIATRCSYYSHRAEEFAAQGSIEREYPQVSRPPDNVRIEHSFGWGNQYAQHEVYPPPQHYPPGYPMERQDIRYTDNYPQVGMNDDASTDFDWSKLSMGIVMLVGGTLVCRRIFRSTGVRMGPIQLQYRNRPDSTAARPQQTVAADRICPRADCASANPPMAKFCRRCGSTLNQA